MRRAMCVAILAATALCLGAQGGARAEQATCKDVYQIYQTCYDGGKQVGPEGCGYLIEALGPRLLSEDGLTGFSAALTVGICKQACADGAGGKSAMSMGSFRKEFCGSALK